MAPSSGSRRTAIEIAVGPRIGISKAIGLPWRFGKKDARFAGKRFRNPARHPDSGGG